MCAGYSEMKEKIVFFAVMVLLVLGAVYTQKNIDHYPFNAQESILYLPSGPYLKPLALGYNEMFADLLWIKTISYFGNHFMADKEYPWLYHMLTLVIDLDPRFDFPYYFGGIVLSLEADQVNNANQILAKGIEAYPEKWEYPFYIGFNHYYHKGDPKQALPFLERAAALPGSPEFLKSLIGSLYLKTEGPEASLAFFREAYRNTQDDMIRKRISSKIEHILSESAVNDTGD